MKVFELFAGYGGASFALKLAGIPHEVVGYSEIDKYAIQCYDQNHYVHDERVPDMGGRILHKNYGDITAINPSELPDFDLLTGGTPCQDFSMAGKREGMFDSEGKPTRSGLVLDYIRILRAKKPQYFVWENVKGVFTVKDKVTGEYQFDFILELFSESGYEIDFRLLNSKDYGTPQNRERVFVIGTRKDLKADECQGLI